MNEPLTIIVEKTKNGLRSPIPLPIGESGQAGVGWSKAEVLAIQQGWLVNDWSGGGFYTITITDDTRPAPQKLSWSPYWPIDVYPEKIPPTLAGSVRPTFQQSQAVTVSPQPQQLQASNMSNQFPNGLPQGGVMVPQQYPMQPGYPQPQYVQPWQQPQFQASQQQFNPYAAQQSALESEKLRQMEAHTRQLEAQLAQQRVDAVQREAQANLERERTANAAMIQGLERKMAEMMATITNGSGRTTDVDKMQAQLDNERREREAERRERELKDLVTQQNTNIQRQIEAMQQNYTLMQQAAANKGPDPMFQLMMEQSRNSMEAMKEIARESNKGMDKYQQYMMTPRDVIQMQKDNSNGLDSVSEKLTKVYGNVLEMHQKVLENALQLNQGGSETVGLIRDGITSAKEAFERYVGAKSKAEQVTQQSQAQTAHAQAQAAAIQAQAQVQIEQMRNQPVHQPRTVPTPAAVPAGNGLGGTNKPANGAQAFEEFQRHRQTNGVASQPTAVDSAVNANGVPAPQAVPLRHGRQDADWFGPFMNEVNMIRMAVSMFMNGLNQKPPVIQGAGPEQVAEAIMQAQTMVITQQLPIPAMIELLLPGHFPQFLEVLIPDSPQQFRADVTQILRKRLDGDVGEPEEDSDESEDDSEEPHDDVQDGQVDIPVAKPINRIVAPTHS